MSLNEEYNKRSSEYKLVLFGNTMVGKTSVANRFIYNRFKENVGTTIGAAYGRIIKDDIPLGIWDTAGQERYLSLVGFYHREADIILMVYDVNDESTIDRLDFYFDKLGDLNNYRLFVIGNKIDLISDNRKDYFKSNLLSKLKDRFSKYNIPKDILYYFVSAKSNENMDKLLNDIISECKGLPIIIEKNTVKVDDNTNWFSSIGSYCSC